MRILVTGADGQLGAALRPQLESRHDIVWTDRDDLDVRDLAGVRAGLLAQRPELILHLAAWTQVDACEQHPDRAYEVNALGTRYVALAAREIGARVLLVSTDYVFDGELGRPYREYDNPAPLNVYGWSKLNAERILAALVPEHIIVRTSGLFGSGGANFPEAILRAAAGEGRLRVVDDQVCRPTYAPHLAEALAAIVAAPQPGSYHVASAGETSWCAFAREILSAAGGDPKRVEPVSSAAWGRPARRPRQSVLDTHAFEMTCGHVLPHWREGLGDFLRQREA